jgi:hypothetical protein
VENEMPAKPSNEPALVVCSRCQRQAGWHDQYDCDALIAFSFWSYQRPIGHSKSRAVLAGDAALTTEWAYAPIKDGVILKSSARSGFTSKNAAIGDAIIHVNRAALGGMK